MRSFALLFPLLLPGCIIAVDGDDDGPHWFSDEALRLTYRSGDLDLRFHGHTLRIAGGDLTLDGAACGALAPGDELTLDDDGVLHVNGQFRYDA